jgi:hypothetical protein
MQRHQKLWLGWHRNRGYMLHLLKEKFNQQMSSLMMNLNLMNDDDDEARIHTCSYFFLLLHWHLTWIYICKTIK